LSGNVDNSSESSDELEFGKDAYCSMHEISIVREAIDIIIASLQDYPASKVISVTLAVGVRSGIDPSALRFVFPLQSEGTRLEGSELLIELMPLQVDCPSCNAGPTSAETPRCHLCGSAQVQIVGGRDLLIRSVEIEETSTDTPQLVNEEVGCQKWN
jgi:hydrogenase nickel incorporation protein HypA/HybF